MYKVHGLSVNIGNKKILENVNFEIEKGTFVSIIGGNGSGKSTIIKTLTKFINTKNMIEYQGEKLEDINNSEYFKKVALLSQFNTMDETIKVRDFIKYGRYPFKSIFSNFTAEDKEIVDKYIKRLNLEEFEHKMIGDLSGGEKQRVYLAQKLVQEPEVLILDEPTNHLDVKYQYMILSLIKEFQLEKGLTVICVLHELNQALKYSDKLVILNYGKLYNTGTVRECLKEDMVREVFGVNVKIWDTDEGYHVDYLIN